MSTDKINEQRRVKMKDKFISLLYPSEQSRDAHTSGAALPDISEAVCDELGLTEIFELKNSRLTDFFTTDEQVILLIDEYEHIYLLIL